MALTHITLESILEVLQNSRDNADVFYAQSLEAQSAEAALNVTRWEDLMTLLNDMNGRVDGINAALEVLNNNASLNAQNQQAILLGAPGACCDDPPILVGLPENMCIYSQQLIASMPSFILETELRFTPPVLPTVADILRAFTATYPGNETTILLSSADANKVLAAIAKLGASRIEDIYIASQDPDVQAAVQEVLGTAINSQSAYIAIQNLPTDGYGQPEDAVAAYFSLYQPSILAQLWADPPVFNGDGYVNDCEEIPPVSGFGYNIGGSTFFPSAGPDTEYVRISSSFDLDTGGLGNISPKPHDRIGNLLPTYVCTNTTTALDTSVQIRRRAEYGGDVLATIELEAIGSFVIPPERYVEIWAKGTKTVGGSDVVIVIAWDEFTLTSSCPS